MSEPLKNPRELLVRIAAEDIGASEEPHGSNLGERIAKFKSATRLDPRDPWPWCAAFVSWVLQEAARRSDQFRWSEVPRIAAVYEFDGWARRNGGIILQPGSDWEPMPGDLVTFKFSHIGIVEHVGRGKGAGVITTIEGNSNDAGEREGYEVCRKARTLAQVRNFIRVPVVGRLS